MENAISLVSLNDLSLKNWACIIVPLLIIDFL
jgi:hypothetical protein